MDQHLIIALLAGILAFIWGFVLGYLVRSFYEATSYSMPKKPEDVLTDYPQLEDLE